MFLRICVRSVSVPDVQSNLLPEDAKVKIYRHRKFLVVDAEYVEDLMELCRDCTITRPHRLSSTNLQVDPHVVLVCGHLQLVVSGGEAVSHDALVFAAAARVPLLPPRIRQGKGGQENNEGDDVGRQSATHFLRSDIRRARLFVPVHLTVRAPHLLVFTSVADPSMNAPLFAQRHKLYVERTRIKSK